MITELAILRVSPKANAGFEAAFTRVEPLLNEAEGHVRHRLVTAVDCAQLYLLEVEWADLAAHKDRFEPSSAHTAFMGALEPFLVDEPTVLHVPAATRRDMLEDEEA